jgi:hypothetical protein
MADEAKAAVACMAAWLRFVIDDLFENCLTHDDPRTTVRRGSAGQAGAH